MYTCISHFATEQKLTQHCKSTILQFLKIKVKKVNKTVNTKPVYIQSLKEKKKKSSLEHIYKGNRSYRLLQTDSPNK